ncbi:MOSC domain-containing protein [Granulosicoccus antarcticus]|uniref:Metal-sulfur cluster biosynthesis proteins YuaD n=1 Tax=Granulosicoccus antarcticus IMCC3135 TaxID=1192854 RepID=A0A2Z2NR35_9GAMM|nr:MOSC domain-containing protein [Granulosicoccus antarcticus]ASJ73946.1 Putative metal-sulfur cluster biosynthesis proteins YuaD [Granulosicoccus antarcticus IMCC3135]
MPILTPTPLTAVITFLGINIDGIDLSTVPQTMVEVRYEGFAGDSHSGLTRRSCVRVKSQYPKDTEIRNTRQISALSAEELELIRESMVLDTIEPSWVGANLIVEGFPDFSKLPPSSRLIAANGTSIVVDMENAPCRFPGDIIEQHRPGKGKLFAKAAQGRRGITLWVERPGTLKIGDELRLHIPPVCNWRLPSAE